MRVSREKESTWVSKPTSRDPPDRLQFRGVFRIDVRPPVRPIIAEWGGGWHIPWHEISSIQDQLRTIPPEHLSKQSTKLLSKHGDVAVVTSKNCWCAHKYACMIFTYHLKQRTIYNHNHIARLTKVAIIQGIRRNSKAPQWHTHTHLGHSLDLMLNHIVAMYSEVL